MNTLIYKKLGYCGSSSAATILNGSTSTYHQYVSPCAEVFRSQMMTLATPLFTI